MEEKMSLAEKQEYFTYEDYLTWDTDERYELIKGVPYLMSPAPTRIHQKILGMLHLKFAEYLDDKTCNVYIAPIDVRLDPDGFDDTVVQPDLLVVCDPAKETDQGISGAPDVVVEILSPSTASFDMGGKFNLYFEAGVTEYWIVDPDAQSVRVFVRKEAPNFTINNYGNEDAVPVAVLGGLTINLKDIFK
jgi:Uma2 family endonuclease